VTEDAPGDRRPAGLPRISRRTLLAGSVATGLAAAGVGAAVGSDAYAAAVSGLGPGGSLLRPGSRPYPLLPEGTDTLPQIEHIVVLMMENHSFDDHLGTLGRGDGLTPGPDGKPVNYNPDPAGGFVRSFHNPNTCGESDSGISQSWDASHVCWDHGTNMGFVKGCSGAAMGYWNKDDLPFYHSMAKRFPIGDRYFSSVMAQTYPNRRFLIAGTALGDISTDASGISAVDAPNGTIFDRLNQHGISWKDYYPDIPTCALFEPVFFDNPGKAVHLPQFFADAASGNLPAFSLVDPYVNFSEESGDISVGEAYAALFIEAVMNGPAWEKTALLWVYDEHGGWYDHVPPRRVVKPDNVPPDLAAGDFPGSYDFTGFRVPCCVVSAWSKEDYVSHQVFDHTSILKLVETKWNLAALTFRDANAHNMLDFFDLKAERPPFAEPPRLKAPNNPFSSPAALPASSLAASDAASFHTVCTELPGGSLPPRGAKLSAPPPDADALMAAQQRLIRRQARAQGD
jgi:phospholipase C